MHALDERNPKRQHTYSCACRNGKHGSSPCTLSPTDTLLDAKYLQEKISPFLVEPLLKDFTTAQR